LAGDIASRAFDPRRWVTEIATPKSFGKEDLAGAVVRVGGQWSVVKESASGRLTVWGKVTDEAAQFEILDHYDSAK
jgi:hypothetical protein